ncbi:uncharacterized protein LOC125505403 [Dendroctonus ponderosae]|uniref:uncharacterized protein LOC125505403 n=1 Tax=Dendroctonus ponderosae TaxID=77166 RepID=UPI002035A86A|nr:uncharacterized protein LOC125505403 [Dendroctonus ponderosae]
MRLSWKYPFIIFPKVSDCLVCSFKIILNLGVLFTSECPHRDKNVLKPRMWSPTWRLYYYALLCSPVFFSWINNFYIWNYAFYESDGFIQEMFGFLTQSWTLILTLSMLTNRHLCVKYFGGIVELLSKRKRYGIPTLLTARDVERHQYSLLFILILSNVIGIVTVASRLADDGFGYVNLTQSMSYYLNIINGAAASMHTVSALGVYEQIFHKLLRLMEKTLETRKNCTNPAFADKLRSYQNYYSSCVINYQNHVLIYTTKLFLAWHFTYVIICQVFLFLYVSILVIHWDLELKRGATTGVIQSFYVVCASFYVVKRANNIYNINDDFLTYLHKYPISRLTKKESYLVEALINNLTNYKPNLVCGDILQMHRRSVPSIISHAITYSLVALQFNLLKYFY